MVGFHQTKESGRRIGIICGIFFEDVVILEEDDDEVLRDTQLPPFAQGAHF